MRRMDRPPCARCPAALPQAGPPDSGPSVVCQVMAAEQRITDQVRAGESVSPVMAHRGDPMILYGFCCGTNLPVATTEQLERLEAAGIGRAHFTACPVWRAAKERDWDRRRMMVEPARRGDIIGAPDPHDFLMTADAMREGGLNSVAPPDPRLAGALRG